MLIRGGAIARIDKDIAKKDADRVIDAEGLIVAPGLIDVHTHLREPGYEWKETIRTGTMAAARGRLYVGRLHGQYGPGKR